MQKNMKLLGTLESVFSQTKSLNSLSKFMFMHLAKESKQI